MIVYILKFSACLAFFILFYKLFLEKENMHQFKRFFLIGSIVLSLVIPMITFTTYIEAPISTRLIPDLILADNGVENKTNYLPFILWTVYALGVLLFGFKFYRNIKNLMVKIKNNPNSKNQNIFYVLLSETVVPHTFFNYIFLNKNKFEKKLIPKEVIWHEESHAQEKHSLDILFIEILQVIFWFNPLIFLSQHLIKLNHEFMADQAVIKKGIHAINYQNILLEFSQNEKQPQLANAINYSFIKKRFTIMKTKTSNKRIWIRSLVILPLLAILIYGFSGRTITEFPLVSDNSLSQKKEFEQFVEHNTLIKKSQTREGDINIYLNNKGDLLIKDNILTKNELLNELQRIKKNSSSENSSSIPTVNLFVNPSIKLEHITDVKNILRQFGATKVIIHYTEDPYKATKEQISEYNKLAKKYNEISKENMIVKENEVEQLKNLYDLMSSEQRKNVQSFPNFPPPPNKPYIIKTGVRNQDINEPYVIQGVNDQDLNIPPPPPPPPVGNKKLIDNMENQSEELQLAWSKFSKESNAYAKAVSTYYKSDKKENYPALKKQHDQVMKLYKNYENLARKEKLAPQPPPPPKE